jgi:hypothetical protein
MASGGAVKGSGLTGVVYQTRLVQEQPERRHDDEDRLLRIYLTTAQDAKRTASATSRN